MKKLFLVCFLALFVSVSFTACSEKKETTHEVQWSENSKDSVVYVNHANNDGSFSNFYMNYMLYRTLFNSGGYTQVHNYYQSHPREFANQSHYNNYKSKSDFATNNNIIKNQSGDKSTSIISSSPSRSILKSTSINNYSSSNKSNSITKTYSSPSRSSSSYKSSSYSSPSRSSYSSSSYSSPSRSSSSYSSSSYSSSRSYSSPSRR